MHQPVGVHFCVLSKLHAITSRSTSGLVDSALVFRWGLQDQRKKLPGQKQLRGLVTSEAGCNQASGSSPPPLSSVLQQVHSGLPGGRPVSQRRSGGLFLHRFLLIKGRTDAFTDSWRKIRDVLLFLEDVFDRLYVCVKQTEGDVVLFVRGESI